MTTQSRLQDVDEKYRARAQAVLDTLQSHFVEMPRGGSFIERDDFQRAYEVFARETQDGQDLSGAALIRAITRDPRAWLVLRCTGSTSSTPPMVRPASSKRSPLAPRRTQRFSTSVPSAALTRPTATRCQ